MKKVNRLIILIGVFCLLSINSFAKKDKENYNFILVHGAWHGAWTWYEVEYLLLKAGYTVTSIDLPGHGTDTTYLGTVTLSDYQNAVVNILDKFQEPSVLVAHSMGGIAISMAAELRPSKVSKLVYVTAFMLQNGQSMIQAALTDTASMILPAIKLDTVHMIVDIDRTYIKDIFYSESSEKYTVLSEKLLKPEPLLPIVTPLTLTSNFNSVRRFYISTEDDRAITPPMQRRMYTALPCEEVFSIKSEHSPFFSRAKDLYNTLVKIAKDDSVTKSVVLNNQEKNSANNAIVIYPNPTTGIINVENVDVASTIQVFDMTGRSIRTVLCSDKKAQLDLNGNPTGQYLVRIKSKGYSISKIINYTN